MIDLDRTFQALANPTRRAIIVQLTSGATPVNDLAMAQDMSLPGLLDQLQVLEECGLIKIVKTGRVNICHLNSDTMTAAQDWLGAQHQNWRDNLDQFAKSMMEDLA